MRRLFALLIPLAAMPAAPASARVVSVETYVEQWDPQSQQWVRLGPEEEQRALLEHEDVAGDQGAERFVPAPAAASEPAIARYGPFRVMDTQRAELVGVTDSRSPAQFAAMVHDFPKLATLDMIECPGTDDDRANLKLGRMIRAAGIATHVPAGGSVRSGAVELFLAGQQQRIDDGAEFAVHSWRDNTGHQPQDFAPDSAENRVYLSYYGEMGFTPERARAFYNMTNSVSFAGAKWLTAQDMRAWLGLKAAQKNSPEAAKPQIAYLDLGQSFP